jgi:hypothetical protein
VSNAAHPFEASSRQRRSADRRLPQALAGLLAIVLLTSGLAWAFLGMALRSLETVLHDRVEALALLHTVNDELQHLVADVAVRAERGVLPMDSAAAVVRGARARADRAWQAYLGTWFTPAESLMVARIAPAVQLGIERAAQLVDTLDARAPAAIERFLDRAVGPDLDVVSTALRELVALQVGVTRDAYAVARARHTIAGQAFVGAVVAASVLVLVALLAGGRRSRVPLRRWTH